MIMAHDALSAGGDTMPMICDAVTLVQMKRKDVVLPEADAFVAGLVTSAQPACWATNLNKSTS